MGDKLASTLARIRVTIEVNGSPYGPEWRLQDIWDQAKRETLAYLHNRLAEKGIRIVGEPEVITITAKESK